MNHVGQVYDAMDEVFEFATTFKEFPPSFVPTTIMQETLDDIRDARKKAEKTGE